MLSIAQLLGPIEPFDISMLPFDFFVFLGVVTKAALRFLTVFITPPLVVYRAKIFALLNY